MAPVKNSNAIKSFSTPPPRSVTFLKEMYGSIRALTTGECLALALLLFVGGVLRLYHLNQDYFTDEAVHVYMAMHSPLFSILTGKLYSVGHPPLYQILLKLWMGILGQSVTAVRLSSVITGVLSIVLVFVLGLKLLGKKPAIMAVGLTAVSPLHIFYSQQIRPYIFLTLVTMVSVLVLLSLLKKPTLPALVLFTLVNVAGMYTHYFYLYVLLTHLVLVLLNSGRDKRHLGLFVSIVISALLFIPWVVGVLAGEWQRRLVTGGLERFSMRIFWALLSDFVALRQPSLEHFRAGPILGLVVGAIAALVLIGAACIRAIKNKNLRTPLLYFFMPLILFKVVELFLGPMITSPADERSKFYFLFTLPAVYLLLSHGVASLRKSLSVIILVILMFPSSFALYAYHSHSPFWQWRMVGTYLASHHTPDDTIIVSPHYLTYSLFPALPAGWPHTFPELSDSKIYAIVNLSEGWRQLFPDGKYPHFYDVEEARSFFSGNLGQDVVIISPYDYLSFEYLPQEFPEDYLLKEVSTFGGLFVGHYMKMRRDVDLVVTDTPGENV